MHACQAAVGYRRGMASSLPSLELKNLCASVGSSSSGSSARENYSIGEHKGGKSGGAFLKRCDGALLGLFVREKIPGEWPGFYMV